MKLIKKTILCLFIIAMTSLITLTTQKRTGKDKTKLKKRTPKGQSIDKDDKKNIEDFLENKGLGQKLKDALQKK